MKNFFLIVFIGAHLTLHSQKVWNVDSTYSATVTRVHDGDSYAVKFHHLPDTNIFIRLKNVDAPEIKFFVSKDQPYGRAAGNHMRNYLKNREVQVTFRYFDIYQRLVCDVRLDSIDLTEYVISNGIGWYLDDVVISATRAEKLKQLQETAKLNKLGLWGEPGRKLRPSTWRKRYSLRVKS